MAKWPWGMDELRMLDKLDFRWLLNDTSLVDVCRPVPSGAGRGGAFSSQRVPLLSQKLAIDLLPRQIDITFGNLLRFEVRAPLCRHAGDLGADCLGAFLGQGECAMFGHGVCDRQVHSVAGKTHLLVTQRLADGQDVEGG